VIATGLVYCSLLTTFARPRFSKLEGNAVAENELDMSSRIENYQDGGVPCSGLSRIQPPEQNTISDIRAHRNGFLGI